MSTENLNFSQGANALGGASSLTGKGCALVGCGGLLVLLLIIGGWIWSTYNSLVTEEQNVETAWAQVENVYQRRADLIPNLVNIVKSAKNAEIEALERTMKARAEATSIKIDPSNMTAEDLQRYQAAQGELGQALSRLMAVSEAYPDIKFNKNYLNFQEQLEGSENRITVERKKFNEAAQKYNTKIKRIPGNIVASLFGFEKKPYFKAEAGAERAPQVPENF